MEILNVATIEPPKPLPPAEIKHIDVRLTQGEALFLGRVMAMLPNSVANHIGTPNTYTHDNMRLALRHALGVRQFLDGSVKALAIVPDLDHITKDGMAAPKTTDPFPVKIGREGEPNRDAYTAERAGRIIEELRDDLAALRARLKNASVTVDGVTYEPTAAAARISNLKLDRDRGVRQIEHLETRLKEVGDALSRANQTIHENHRVQARQAETIALRTREIERKDDTISDLRRRLETLVTTLADAIKNEAK